ncbi:HAD domain-containing protein [Aeromicrobium sp. 179-A 4D2 NHS]|uniref:HAD domain-containing protein n=1 Tax=Aeromicrobium sp. 179-A 4D2 NHS TaxID=3142375 RepID=UPI00399F2820
MTDARWYLDIDGVVSAMYPPAIAHTYLSVPVPGNGDHWIQPKVVEFINKASCGGVEVVWLTSWERDDVISAFAPAAWLPEFRHLPCVSEYGVEDFDWKRKALIADLEANPVKSVVWTDDDVTPDDIAAVKNAASRALILAPTPSAGLTSFHTTQIAEFLHL